MVRRHAGAAHRRQIELHRDGYRLAALVLAADRNPARGFVLQVAQWQCLQRQLEPRHRAEQEHGTDRLRRHHHSLLTDQAVAAADDAATAMEKIDRGWSMKKILLTTV